MNITCFDEKFQNTFLIESGLASDRHTGRLSLRGKLYEMVVVLFGLGTNYCV